LTSTAPPSSENAPNRRRKARSFLYKLGDFASVYSLLGAVAGIFAGLWAAGAHHQSLVMDESSILLAMAGGDLALLAIILAAVALMSALLKGHFARVIKTAVGLDLFFFPFKVVTCVCAAGGLASFAGAIHAGWGSKTLRSALFGFSAALTAWAILGTALLTFTFIQFAVREEREKDREKAREQDRAP